MSDAAASRDDASDLAISELVAQRELVAPTRRGPSTGRTEITLIPGGRARGPLTVSVAVAYATIISTNLEALRFGRSRRRTTSLPPHSSGRSRPK